MAREAGNSAMQGWWGPITAMWTYRLSPLRAKQPMSTYDVIDGRAAAEWGQANPGRSADQLAVEGRKSALLKFRGHS